MTDPHIAAEVSQVTEKTYRCPAENCGGTLMADKHGVTEYKPFYVLIDFVCSKCGGRWGFYRDLE